ncbi:hypothetical protein [Empedobacter tilapiae]|nr:hypothetical protein [Empedobacter tilapiae]
MKKVLLIVFVFLGIILNAQCWANDLFIDIANSKNDAFKAFYKNAPVENYDAYKILSESKQLRQDPNTLEALAGFTKKQSDYIKNNPGRIEKIIDNLKSENVRCTTCTSGSNKGLPPMHVIIDDLDWALITFKDKPDVIKVLTEMSASGPKADGGAFMLNTLRNKPKEFINSIEGFEIKYLPDRQFEADIKRAINGRTHLGEYKSYKKTTWENFPNNTGSVDQLMGYLKSGEDFSYTANIMKLADADNPTRFVKEQFQKVFKKNVNEIFKPTEKGGMSISNIRKQFGENIETPKDFLDEINNFDSKIYKNIIVE